MPQFKADDALSDALHAFEEVASQKTEGKLILMGSSSGGRRF
jgi:acetyl esterase/lipase